MNVSLTPDLANYVSQKVANAVSRTGYQTDLAVSGDGFFITRDPVTNAHLRRAMLVIPCFRRRRRGCVRWSPPVQVPR